MLFDIHCHLDQLDDPESALLRARDAGLALIVTHGTDAQSNRASERLAAEHADVVAAMGLYPNDAIGLSAEERDAVLEQIRAYNAPIIGEVGLDYHHDDAHKEEMKAVFSRILDLAEEMDAAVVVHSRKAEADVISMLQEHPDVRADLHCFGGSLKLAGKAVDLGCWFSIPASIVRATHFQRLVEEVPIEHLLTETDAPWLSPDDGPNEPANVSLVVEQIARIKDIDVDTCASTLRDNLLRFAPALSSRFD